MIQKVQPHFDLDIKHMWLDNLFIRGPENQTLIFEKENSFSSMDFFLLNVSKIL